MKALLVLLAFSCFYLHAGECFDDMSPPPATPNRSAAARRAAIAYVRQTYGAEGTRLTSQVSASVPDGMGGVQFTIYVSAPNRSVEAQVQVQVNAEGETQVFPTFTI